MIRPSRAIPRVATASLLLGGAAGCDSRPYDAELVYRITCAYWQKCEASLFASNYASLAECVADQIDFADYYASLYGERCGDALADYYHCLNENAYHADCSYNSSAADQCYVDLAKACGWF